MSENSQMVAQLQALKDIPDSELLVYVKNNMASILKCEHYDIIDAIEDKDDDVIRKLRNSLLSDFGELFKEYDKMTPRNRKNVRLMCKDICNLAESILLKKPFNTTTIFKVISEKATGSKAASVVAAPEPGASSDPAPGEPNAHPDDQMPEALSGPAPGETNAHPDDQQPDASSDPTPRGAPNAHADDQQPDASSGPAPGAPNTRSDDQQPDNTNHLLIKIIRIQEDMKKMKEDREQEKILENQERIRINHELTSTRDENARLSLVVSGLKVELDNLALLVTGLTSTPIEVAPAPIEAASATPAVVTPVATTIPAATEAIEATPSEATAAPTEATAAASPAAPAEALIPPAAVAGPSSASEAGPVVPADVARAGTGNRNTASAHGRKAVQNMYEIFIGNASPACTTALIKNVICGIEIKRDLVKVNEIPLNSGKKAFKATVPHINHPDAMIALMCSDENLSVQKFRHTKQRPMNRQASGGRPNHNFRKPSSYQQQQHQQRQFGPNYPVWNNPGLPFSPHWDFFGPRMPSFGPPGWGYQ